MERADDRIRTRDLRFTTIRPFTVLQCDFCNLRRNARHLRMDVGNRTEPELHASDRTRRSARYRLYFWLTRPRFSGVVRRKPYSVASLSLMKRESRADLPVALIAPARNLHPTAAPNAPLALWAILCACMVRPSSRRTFDKPHSTPDPALYLAESTRSDRAHASWLYRWHRRRGGPSRSVLSSSPPPPLFSLQLASSLIAAPTPAGRAPFLK